MSVMACSTLGNETERNGKFVLCEMRNLYFANETTLLPVIDLPLVNRIYVTKGITLCLSKTNCSFSIISRKTIKNQLILNIKLNEKAIAVSKGPQAKALTIIVTE